MEKYITEFTNKSNEKYILHVWANSFEHAQELVDMRGINETVLGKTSA